MKLAPRERKQAAILGDGGSDVESPLDSQTRKAIEASLRDTAAPPTARGGRGGRGRGGGRGGRGGRGRVQGPPHDETDSSSSESSSEGDEEMNEEEVQWWEARDLEVRNQFPEPNRKGEVRCPRCKGTVFYRNKYRHVLTEKCHAAEKQRFCKKRTSTTTAAPAPASRPSRQSVGGGKRKREGTPPSAASNDDSTPVHNSADLATKRTNQRSSHTTNKSTTAPTIKKDSKLPTKKKRGEDPQVGTPEQTAGAIASDRANLVSQSIRKSRSSYALREQEELARTDEAAEQQASQKNAPPPPAAAEAVVADVPSPGTAPSGHELPLFAPVPSSTVIPYVERYTTRYAESVGIAFLLSNKHCGVLFRDGSCMILDPKSGKISYRNRHGNRFSIKSFTGRVTLPKKLKNKLVSVLWCRDVLSTGKEPMLQVGAKSTTFTDRNGDPVDVAALDAAGGQTALGVSVDPMPITGQRGKKGKAAKAKKATTTSSKATATQQQDYNGPPFFVTFAAGSVGTIPSPSRAAQEHEASSILDSSSVSVDVKQHSSPSAASNSSTTLPQPQLVELDFKITNATLPYPEMVYYDSDEE